MTQKKILIADDNENIREALTYLLEDEGYKLSMARDGAETLAKARDIRPDILFLDIMILIATVEVVLWGRGAR